MAGRGGEPTPAFIIDTSSRGTQHTSMMKRQHGFTHPPLTATAIVRGVIREWPVLRAAWKQSFDSLGLTSLAQRGLVFGVLEGSTQEDVGLIVQTIFKYFPISSIFLTNPWVPIVHANHESTGLVIHVGDTMSSVAPVIDHRVIHEGISYIAMGCNDISASICTLITQALNDEENGAVRTLSDPTVTFWRGLSIIASMPIELREFPSTKVCIRLFSGYKFIILLQHGTLGTVITRAQYEESGISALFGSSCPGILFTIDSKPAPSRVSIFSDWTSPDQWSMKKFHSESALMRSYIIVCLFTDATQTFVGRSGEADPLVTVPTKKVAKFYERGTVTDWKVMNAIWRTAIKNLNVIANEPRGVILTVPSFSTMEDIKKMTDTLFSNQTIASILLTHVWVPVLMAHDIVTGVVVHVGDTESFVVSMVSYGVSRSSMALFPFGKDGDIQTKLPLIVDVS